jgi:hypothetical protein
MPEDPVCAQGMAAFEARKHLWTFTEEAGGDCAPIPSFSSVAAGCGTPSNSTVYGTPEDGAYTFAGSGSPTCSYSGTCDIGALCTGAITIVFTSNGSFSSGQQTLDCLGESVAMGGAGCSATYTVTAVETGGDAG